MAVYKSLGSSSAPSAQYPHAARWYRHIKSYAAEHSGLPGDASKDAESYLPSSSKGTTSAPAASAAAADDDDDDEVDLFGSDDEADDAEAEKLKQARVKEYQEKKSKKPATIAKVS